MSDPWDRFSSRPCSSTKGKQECWWMAKRHHHVCPLWSTTVMFAALLYDCGGIRVKNHKSNDHQSAFSCPGLARNHAQMTWSRDDLHQPSFFHVLHNRFGLEAYDIRIKKVNGQKLLQKLLTSQMLPHCSRTMKFVKALVTRVAVPINICLNRSRQTSRLRCMISWVWCIKYCTWFPTSEIIINIHKETKFWATMLHSCSGN